MEGDFSHQLTSDAFKNFNLGDYVLKKSKIERYLNRGDQTSFIS
jgi:hypothetical protein